MNPAILIVASLLAAAPATAPTTAPATAPSAGWKLIWSDEFAKPGRPDPDKWAYELGMIRNREAQCYTDSPQNVHVADGNLIIEARKERTAVPRRPNRIADYSSASIQTLGKAEWSHGRIEVRAKLPAGRGMWPAIWTLGTNIDNVGWPACGEIDIMENVGYEPDKIHASIHTKAYNHVKKTEKTAERTIAKASEDFHVYAVEWDDDAMQMFIDGESCFTFRNEHTGDDTWPFSHPQFLKLNLAVGGEWGGRNGIDDAIFPQKFYIDYVRVYQHSSPPSR